MKREKITESGKIIILFLLGVFLTIYLVGCNQEEKYLQAIEGIYQISESKEDSFVPVPFLEERYQQLIRDYKDKSIHLLLDGDFRVEIRTIAPDDIIFVSLQRPSDQMNMKEYTKKAKKLFLIEFFSEESDFTEIHQRYCYIDGEIWMDTNSNIVMLSHKFVKLEKIS